jgi:antitoxin component YwqK of YwqJK toxin-antitoxin module
MYIFKLSHCVSLLVSLVLLWFLSSCAEDKDEKDNIEWKGGFESFEDSFESKQTLDSTNSDQTLFMKGEDRPFTGSVERNSSTRFSMDDYKKGKLDGVSIRKSLDGSWVEANYKNGKLHGEMTFYGTNGNIRSVMRYENGILVPQK